MAGRLAGAHARDLRPTRQAADRLGQRPADDRRPRRAAVDVVARGAVTRHVASAVVCRLARVCSAPQCCTASIARASANRPHPDRVGTSRRRSRPCSSTATSRARSRSRRLQANVRGKRIRRVQGAMQDPAHVTFHENVSPHAQHSTPAVPRTSRAVHWTAQRIGAAGCARRMQQREKSRGVGCGDKCAR